MFDLIWKVVKSVFEGVHSRCTWPKCEQEPEYVAQFSDGQVEPRCGKHYAMPATPEK